MIPNDRIYIRMYIRTDFFRLSTSLYKCQTEKFTHQGQCKNRILTTVLTGSVAHVLHLSTIFEAEPHIFPDMTSTENSLEVSTIVVYFRNELSCVSWNIFYA